MTNWRKPIIEGFLACQGLNLVKTLRFCDYLSRQPPEAIASYQEKKIKKLIEFSVKYIPYYRRVLEECGAVHGNSYIPGKWKNIPILTKDIIRREGDNLQAQNLISHGKYKNMSGGSTGEPITIWQDKEYWLWNNIFSKFYFNDLLGKKYGEPEVNIWGSTHDYRRNSVGIKNNFVNFLYNRKFLNFFYVDENKLQQAVTVINHKRPVAIWAYVHSIDILAKYIRKRNLKIYSPRLIISTAGTLFPEIKESVEEVFRTKVYNQYGSREVGGIACQCSYQSGLHGFPWSNYIEVINGEVVVTVLTNKTMPLIRYRLDDTAIASANQKCRCGRNTLVLDHVTGRVNDHFIQRGGTKIAGAYFNKLLYHVAGVKKFQIIQEDYEVIRFKIVRQGKILREEELKIEKLAGKIMGKKCQIIWDFVDDIPVSPSGKYRFTMTKLKS